jgi:hypothetical protein
MIQMMQSCLRLVDCCLGLKHTVIIVQPLWRHDDSLDYSKTLVYRISDMINHANKTDNSTTPHCGAFHAQYPTLNVDEQRGEK